MKKAISPLFQIGLCTFGYLYATSNTTLAQVTSDNTVNTQVNQNGSVAEITGGETRDSNLFHSFQEFSVPTGNQAFFNNATDISNIFSRVTGGKISNIDGLIRANGDASLFLINPAGIIFGEGARLDLGGSFYGSSASSILFEDGEFSAVDLENPPLLTVNAPIGLGFRDNPGDIKLNQSELNSNADIALIGGDINFDQGKANATNIQLGGLAEAGTINFNSDTSFSFPDAVTKADVSLINNSFLGISGTIGGLISVNANNITHTDDSNAIVGIENDINFQADNNIFFDNNSLIIAQVSSDQSGNSGDISLVAKGNISFDNRSSILSQVLLDSKGDAGDIDVKANSLDLGNGSFWITNTAGEGNAGEITIDVANHFSLNQGSLILSQVLTGGTGDAGDINITTGSLELTNSLIIADSSDLGNAGNINIFAEDTIVMQGSPKLTDKFFDNAEVFSSTIITGLNENINLETNVVESTGQGDGGNIDITASQLILKDLAFIISNVEETTIGNGGEINLNLDLLRLENNAFVSTFTESKFKAGSINVNSKDLELVSGGKLITSTEGIGSAGTINLNITDKITIDNGVLPTVPRGVFNEFVLTELQGRSGLFANATTRATGNGGNIFIGQNLNSPTTDITIANGGEVRADGGINGNAGNIFISANSLSLDGDAVIVAETVSDQGANINLQLVDNLTLNNNSSISAQAFNVGNGGNLTIDTNFLIAFPNGNNDIIANAERGNGGNINITAESLLGIKERALNPQTNDINASSEFSLDGNVTINTPDINPLQGATELPTNVVEPQQTTTQACQANREIAAKNNLIIKGKGGVPPAPHLPLNSHNITINGENTDSTASIPQPIETSQGKIQPARGITVTEDGRVILTAYRTNNQGDRLPPESLNCDRV